MKDHLQNGSLMMGHKSTICIYLNLFKDESDFFFFFLGATLMAAFDLLVALATGCLPNLKLIAEMLTEMFYSDKDDAILDWEYLPPVGPRPHNGFVGQFTFTNHRWRCCLFHIF